MFKLVSHKPCISYVFVILIGFMLAGWLVSRRLKNKFREYSQTPLLSGMTGAEVAHRMLRDNRIYDVAITCIEGQLTDHYDPTNKTINLSYEVYHGQNAAAAAVAAHETGHAIQHATAYGLLELRSKLVPIQIASGRILNFIFMFSLIGSLFLGAGVLPYQTSLLIIIGCYAVISLFSIITLPVELDASKRALAWIESRGVVTQSEYAMSKDALKWAAMTYFVGALSSITMLFYYVLQYIGLSDD